jgi:hypothetical protein
MRANLRCQARAWHRRFARPVQNRTRLPYDRDLSLSRLTNVSRADGAEPASGAATEAPFLADSHVEDERLYEPQPPVTILRRVLTRDGVLVGAVLIGDRRDGQSIVDAVAARAPASVEPVANVTVTGVAGSAAPPAPAAP